MNVKDLVDTRCARIHSGYIGNKQRNGKQRKQYLVHIIEQCDDLALRYAARVNRLSAEPQYRGDREVDKHIGRGVHNSGYPARSYLHYAKLLGVFLKLLLFVLLARKGSDDTGAREVFRGLKIGFVKRALHLFEARYGRTHYLVDDKCERGGHYQKDKCQLYRYGECHYHRAEHDER